MNFQQLETIFEYNREGSEASASNSISYHSNSSNAPTILDLGDTSFELLSWFTSRFPCAAIYCIDEQDCSVVDRERAMHIMYSSPAKIEAVKPLPEGDPLELVNKVDAADFAHAPSVRSSTVGASRKTVVEDDETTAVTTVSLDSESPVAVDSHTSRKKKLMAASNKIQKLLTFKRSIKMKKRGRRPSLV